MIKNSKVLLEPTSEPVSTAQVKAQAYITTNDRDTVISDLIKVARVMCERYAGLSFMTQTRVMKLDFFPACKTEVIELPYGPVQAISGNDAASPTPNALGISYVDEDGDTVTLAVTTDFYLDSHSDIPRLYPVDSWPTDYDCERTHPITITYSAGYSSASDVPPAAKQAIISQAIHMHEHGSGMCDEAISYLDTIKVYYNAHQD
jgi:uncharacterized phiE125 gp8 family phage protein